MDSQFLGTLGAGLVLGLSAVGTAIGMGIAGAAAIGSSKRCYRANKPVPMFMLTFVGFPLTLTIYGFILMQQILAVTVTPENAGLLFGYGVGAGLVMAVVAAVEGKAGAAACDSLSDTGKGVGFYIAILGIMETVALFTMVFTMTNLT
ncbi:MAG: V-type ATP synthase subunit K [Dehalococcoidia bacterium]|nr:V-type ATP synthase subunit K [Dehalococcoidia bacterium]